MYAILILLEQQLMEYSQPDSLFVRSSFFLLPQSFPTRFHAATIPTAIFSERYNNRRIPMIAGVIIVIGSQIMLMEAPVYAVMCVARVLQGIGSSVVWVVGLALL